jgi:hypothetical protein
MSLHMPITREKIRNHFHYSFWKYLLLIVIALFGWNLLYTVTRYRPPENRKVEFYAEGNVSSSDMLQSLADLIHQEVMPEMEEVTATTVSFDSEYGDMQLTVWISAGQGDVYLLSQKRFESMASNEATLELQPWLDEGALHADGIDLTNGYATDSETGAQVLRGIPADSLTGLNEYGLDPEGMVLCVLYNNGNDAYSIKFMDYLLTHMRGAESGLTDGSQAMSTETPTVVP